MNNKTLFETVFNNIKINLAQVSDELFPDMDKRYIDDWFKANQENTKDMNFMTKFLNCTPEDIVNDIFHNFVCEKVAKKLTGMYKAVEGREKEIKKTLSHILYSVVFQSYYGNSRATEAIYAVVRHELNLKISTPFTFKDLKHKMANMSVGSTFKFVVKNPDKTGVDGVIYTAFAVMLDGNVYYGFHSIDDNDWAAMANGFENITVEMLTELVKYNDERFEQYWVNGEANPVIYVLD